MDPPIVSLRGARLADGPHLLFDGVDIALAKGELACLVGRNGAGKSTLLRMLAGIAAPDDGERVVRPGLKIALVPQEPSVTGETLEAFAVSGGAPSHAARGALESFGLNPDRTTSGLSGGEARRAALARAFAGQPDVLLLDEPTNHLDILAIAQLEARLARLRAATLVVSHDRAFLERVAERCFWLENRKVRRLDRGFKAFEAWADQVSEADAETARRLDKAIERDERWLAFGVTARRARNEGRLRRLATLRQEKSKRMALARGIWAWAAPPLPSGRLVIEAKGLSQGFGGRNLIDGFSTRVLRGEKVAIVGPNGAGKTTLARLLTGQMAPDKGMARLGAGVELVFISQDRAELSEEASLFETLAPGGGDQVMVQGRPRHVAGYAADFLFRPDQLRQPVRALSGGERNRLLLALALARPSNLMVLDEPTNDLDMETLDLLAELLADYDGTLILVSHDRDFIDRVATSTIALDGRGRAVETPGGWSDFVSQNPGFFAPPEAAPIASRPAPARPRGPSARLTYRDERRLAELETSLPALGAAIAALEERLADPGLYGRDPAAFNAAITDLAAARAALAAAEHAWLDLETRREALTRG